MPSTVSAGPNKPEGLASSKSTTEPSTTAENGNNEVDGRKADPEDHATETKDSEAFHRRFVMKNEIAKGSFGTVWIANRIGEDTDYAVKVIDRTCLKAKDKESIFREVAILEQLQSNPNVIPLVEFLVEPKYLYVVQFYAQGGDLFRRLTQRKQYTEKDARDVAVILFQTLEDMHTTHKVVHRDLKPENLLLEDLISEKVYVADFGFARHIVPEGLKTRCGTPAFVAPEIILGRKYWHQVDMWSIGVIL